MWFIINHVLRRSKSNQSDMACGKVTFSRFSFFWVFSCAFCVGLLWSPPVYCVEVAGLLCRSRRFTVSKSPWFTASLLCWSRRFTVSKSPFYHVEVAILYGWSSFVGVLSCIASRDKVVWLSWYEVWWFFSAGNQNKKKASKKTLERGNESK